ncbi:ABC transporter permease [Cohnella faecalis]|uniref:DUF3533 domain-containing protein n=1 Tax=Cohnella faecalis TaxID=2315694 RepID=A0A398CEN6_9BACL|nr:ABC transporter permease [Cohnella faecalis]RIE01173.1 DUF3533 domain-containing protein [Cohnella faecalis]
MIHGIKKFLLAKTTIAAIGVAIIYQFIMIGVVLPGYSAMPKNIEKLPIAIVNEDNEQGNEIVNQLKEKLPLKIVEGYSLIEAENALDKRELYLIIHIPEDFTANLTKQDKQVTINFHINEASQALVSSTVKMIATEMSSTFGAQVQKDMMKGVFAQMQMPEEQANAKAEMVATKFNANVIETNEVRDGMHNRLAPLFLNVANNVSAMMVSLILVKSLNRLRPLIGKWQSFIGLIIAVVIVAVLAPLGGLGIFFSIENYGADTFFTMWAAHSLIVLASTLIFLISTMLFGEIGMLINMGFVFTQIVSGTGILPREMLYNIFDVVRVVSPMYYAVQADFTTLFGGSQLAPYLLGLVLLAAGGLFITACIHACIPEDREPRPSII